MTATVDLIQRFPIKGLSPERMESVTLTAGEGVPGDRMFGFARYGAGFDPDNPQPLPKDKFLVLMTEAELAGLATRFSAETMRLEITAAENRQSFDMGTADGQSAAADWLAAYLELEDVEPPTFVSSNPHRFTDVSVVSPQMMNAVSLLNRASVRDLEARLDTPVDPARFRANIEFDGLPPWWELENVGATLQIGDAALRLVMRTKRCAATEVNPATAARDLKLPYLLRKELGHMDMGVYAEVLSPGRITPGMTVRVA